jgi:signal transduction histidine kinase
LLGKFNELLNVAKIGGLDKKLVAEIESRIERCDLDFLTEEIPHAVEQSLEGVSRISKIVQSMRTFAHPGAMEKQPTDINKAIESTVLIAHNEWKYVAELETFYDATLPLVPCQRDEFNRVILNMIINATHSIAEVVGKDPRVRGKISVRTKRIGDKWAEIQISDTGTGIPPEVQNRIFDPFFTTKEVGKGTGQGLAISHNVIVEKHGGQITFETECGYGTTFHIRLPLKKEKIPTESLALI